MDGDRFDGGLPVRRVVLRADHHLIAGPLGQVGVEEEGALALRSAHPRRVVAGTIRAHGAGGNHRSRRVPARTADAPARPVRVAADLDENLIDAREAGVGLSPGEARQLGSVLNLSAVERNGYRRQRRLVVVAEGARAPAHLVVAGAVARAEIERIGAARGPTDPGHMPV